MLGFFKVIFFRLFRSWFLYIVQIQNKAPSTNNTVSPYSVPCLNMYSYPLSILLFIY
uniref:Uncharacterized protein n=1 Tax=Anguilla anguilla TaxID=7936 RepID=A0A0E9R861_ANGAN